MAAGKREKHFAWKGGLPICLCGKKLKSYYSKQCKSCYAKDNIDLTVKKGKEGAKKRWFGHIKKQTKKVYKYNFKKSSIKRTKLTPEQLLEHKRFRNQRYKARKKLAIGSHSLDEWLLLKAYYNYMCLCCKKQEPEIKLSEDHIVPLSMNGSDYIDNIQPLCMTCNLRKHAKTISYLPISSNNLDFTFREKGVN